MEDREALAKLASDLTDRVDALTAERESLLTENANLKAALSNLDKQASEDRTVPYEVSDELVSGTLDALVKTGAIREDQREACEGALRNDPEAPFRVLGRYLDAHAQEKRASRQPLDNLEGGRLASQPARPDAYGSCYDRMTSILGLI